MSGLHEAFDEIVADVPVYGDLDHAIEQAAQDADRERRRRYAAVVALTAALAVIVGLVVVSRGTDSAPPVSPTPTPTPTHGPSPSPTDRTQSPQTWSDTTVAATHDGSGWYVPDPLAAARDTWIAVVAEHLDTAENHLTPVGGLEWGGEFTWPAQGSEYDANTAASSAYATYGRVGLVVEPGDPNLLDDGCGYLLAEHDGGPAEQVSCSTRQLAGPDGERASISSWNRRCGAYEGGGPAPATCGDYEVGVAVERRDGHIGYIVVSGRGTPDFNPFPPTALAAAAADPRLTLPARAFTVPSDQSVASVVAAHLPRYPAARTPYATEHPGYAQTWGRVGDHGIRVTVRPAGQTPTCGRGSLVECVERHVFGADDPTTVFVGTWDVAGRTDLRTVSLNSRREFVYVGPHHTVVVYVGPVNADEGRLDGDLEQRLIDLVLDPRLQ